MTTTIWHNPRCSKSRQTLQLLEQQGITPEIYEYLKTPPSQVQLQTVLTQLGLSPLQLLRANEAEAKAQELSNADDQTILTAMLNCPKLIERPIVVHQQKARLGRPPENVLDLF